MTASIGHSFVSSLYATPLTVLLRGELGAGKTTFAKGLAAGMGIEDRVVSPTFALEQRYHDAKLIHIDLYRLSQADADAFLRASDDFSYLRLIEWPSATWSGDGASVFIDIEEHDRENRTLHFSMNDMPLPTAAEIQKWHADVQLPPHIVRHIETVAQVAATLAEDLIKRCIFVRREALKAAALTHDLLRFVDFKSAAAHPDFVPAPGQLERWDQLKAQYGAPHESAAAQFLTDRGYAHLGAIVLSHGSPKNGLPGPKTIEQRLLAYADKRVKFDEVVTLDTRFDDFIARYGNGTESEHNRIWRENMKKMERELFPDGPPL